ncbi:MAG: hypothetical protein BJ554DRAFT_6013, partial [Olpidium bornovanus]
MAENDPPYLHRRITLFVENNAFVLVAKARSAAKRPRFPNQTSNPPPPETLHIAFPSGDISVVRGPRLLVITGRASVGIIERNPDGPRSHPIYRLTKTAVLPMNAAQATALLDRHVRLFVPGFGLDTGTYSVAATFSPVDEQLSTPLRPASEAGAPALALQPGLLSEASSSFFQQSPASATAAGGTPNSSAGDISVEDVPLSGDATQSFSAAVTAAGRAGLSNMAGVKDMLRGRLGEMMQNAASIGQVISAVDDGRAAVDAENA